MSSDHRAQAPVTRPSEELADESDVETIVSSDGPASIIDFGCLLPGEPSFILSEADRRLILKIIVEKATELQNVHWGHRLKAYPVLYIGKDGEVFCVSEEPKPVDLDGGSNPLWNIPEVIELGIDEVRQKKLYLFVMVESKSKLSCRGSRFVGEASIAIEDLLNDYGDSVNWKSVKLRVKNKKGDEHGTVTLKYKFGKTHGPQSADPLILPADDPLSQSANGNLMDQMCKKNSHSTLKEAATKGVAGGATHAFIDTLFELFLGSL